MDSTLIDDPQQAFVDPSMTESATQDVISQHSDTLAAPTAHPPTSSYEDGMGLDIHYHGVDPNALWLADVLTSPDIAWRIHNCKLSDQTVTQDAPLPFLYHYDSLDDAIKHAHPLTPDLLAHFNTLMRAEDAATLLGVDANAIRRPWHVKVSGSLVVYSDALQLAVRLRWTNTGKAAEQCYTQHAADALKLACEDWQFFGRVDVLYKDTRQPLLSMADGRMDTASVDHASGDLGGVDHDGVDKGYIDNQPINHQPINNDGNSALYVIDPSTHYQCLPAAHAQRLITQLEAVKDTLPWFEDAIAARVT